MFFHIGVGKTGTTAFQKKFLAQSAGIWNVGRPTPVADYKAVHWMLTRAEDCDVDGLFLEKWFGHHYAAAHSKKKVAVFSDETLLGSTKSIISLIWRLHTSMPECKILVSMRSQMSLIKSFYLAHASHLKDVPNPHRGRYVSFDSWFE